MPYTIRTCIFRQNTKFDGQEYEAYRTEGKYANAHFKMIFCFAFCSLVGCENFETIGPAVYVILTDKLTYRHNITSIYRIYIPQYFDVYTETYMSDFSNHLSDEFVNEKILQDRQLI